MCKEAKLFGMSYRDRSPYANATIPEHHNVGAWVYVAWLLTAALFVAYVSVDWWTKFIPLTQ
jgi:hypothetical protein